VKKHFFEALPAGNVILAASTPMPVSESLFGTKTVRLSDELLA